MEPKIKITNAEPMDNHIIVSYDVLEGDEIIATGSKKYSLQCGEEMIEKHLKRILKTKEYAKPVDETENPLDAAAITAEALMNRVIIKDDRIK